MSTGEIATDSPNELLKHARQFLSAGLSPLPAERRGNEKRICLKTWKEFKERPPRPDDLEAWFTPTTNAIALLCGVVSGNLEAIDFDLCGEAFDPWRDSVEGICPGLLSRLVVELTPSGGRHVVYRCSGPVSGNTKLASKRIEADGPEELIVGGKAYKPRTDASGRWHIIVTLIETRGEGGVFLCAPSDGYTVIQGDLPSAPVISSDERDVLLGCAAALDQAPRPVLGDRVSKTSSDSGLGRPGDDYNVRGDVRELLQKHGWLRVRDGENEHWCRPGKERGTSATLKNQVFFVFSSNAPPFEPQKGYAPFAVYALLEHDGDWSTAAKALRAQGFGDDPRGPNPSVPVQTSEPPAAKGLVPSFVSAAALSEKYPRLRAPVIDKLLRQGETMNVIAAPKTGKSWLTVDLALSVATGSPWLGRYETIPGDVLILDNELHAETLASRIPVVARARNLDYESVGQHVFVESLRGRLQNIFALDSYFDRVEPGRFKLIILDAFYRFMPVGGDENDNATMANIYNAIDAYADQVGCGFVLIHHSTKGNQSSKGVTDVGAGAGSQSRATDTHLVMRHHEEEGCVVLDAAVRSWAPIEPIGLRWIYPVWDYDSTLDPSHLRQERPSKRKSAESVGTPSMDVDEFVATFISEPVTRDQVVAAAAKTGISRRAATEFIRLAVSNELVAAEQFNGRSAPRLIPTQKSRDPNGGNP